MFKPEGFDNAEAIVAGSYDKLKAGSYVVKILKAAEERSKESNRPMMVLLIDIDEGPHKGHFRKLFEFLKSRNSESKWPCVFRRCMDGDQTPYFKGDIKAIEESNSGFKFNFDEKTLAGKVVGCMFGEKEIDGQGKTILEPRFLCSSGKARIGDLAVPKVKKFAGYKSQVANPFELPPEQGDGRGLFSEDDLPF